MHITFYQALVYNLNILKSASPFNSIRLLNTREMFLKMKESKMIHHPIFLKPKEDKLLIVYIKIEFTFYSSNWLRESLIFIKYCPNMRQP